MSTRSFASINTRVSSLPVAKVKDDSLRFATIIGLVMGFLVFGTYAAGKYLPFAALPIIVFTVMRFSSTNPLKALCIFIMYCGMEGMYKYLSGYSQIVYLIRPFLTAVILFGLINNRRRANAKLDLPPLAPLVIFLGIWSIFAIFSPLGVNITGGLASAVLWYLGPMAAFFVSYNVLKRTRSIEMLLYTFVAVTVVMSLDTILQFKMGCAWTEAHLPGYATMNEGIWWVRDSMGHVLSTSFRPASTADIGGGGGIWSCWGTVIAMGLLLYPKINRKIKVAVCFCLLILFMGVFCSAARVCLLSTIAVTVFLVAITGRTVNDKLRNVGLVLLVGLIAIAAVNLGSVVTGGVVANRYATTLADPMGKYNHDRGGFLGRAQMLFHWASNYPLGVGYQRGTESGGDALAAKFNYVNYQENRDDQFNAITGDLGLMGLLVLVWLLIAIMYRSFKTYAKLKEPGLHVIGAILLTLVMSVIVMCFAGPLIQAQDSFWIFCGACFALPVVQRRESLLLTEISGT